MKHFEEEDDMYDPLKKKNDDTGRAMTTDPDLYADEYKDEVHELSSMID
jgi:hypothetical protein